MNYTFPQHYPKGCPPQPHEDNCGIYYRLVKNTDKFDSSHFKSYYDQNEKPKLELTKPCSRRAISMFTDINEVISLSKQFELLGKYIAKLNLKGGHGVVHKERSYSYKTHYNWWIPVGVIAQNYCLSIKGPIP